MDRNKEILFDVIILSKGEDITLKTLTENCITSLFDSEHDKILFNCIVIESANKLKPYNYPRTTTIYPNTKFGFNKFVNIGLTYCKGDFVCIANNDLIFDKNWALNLVKAFKEDSNLESASPICPFFHPQINIHLDSGNYYGYEIRKEIVGWCIVLKKSLLNKIGKFDEKFKFWFADADYAMLLKSLNVKHALITNSVVKHLDGSTTKSLDKKNKIAMTSGQFWYFQYKWGHKNYFLYLYREFRSFLRINSLR